MTKIFLVGLLLTICLLGRCQKSTPGIQGPETGNKGGSGGVSFSTFGSGGDRDVDSSGSCTVRFNVNGRAAYTETLTKSHDEAHKRSFSSQYNNKIDEIEYECDVYCWIVLFTGNAWGASSIGFWTPEYSDTIDLSNYMSYDQSNNVWDHWDSVASSYSIYCYF